MHMSVKFALRTAIAAAALTAFSLPAITPAQAGEVGMLTCRSPQSTNYVVWSSRTYSCVFHSSAGGRRQYYTATLNRFGAQIGFSNNVNLAWAVFAASSHVGQGALAGSYAGASAGAAVGLGARANALVGGGPNSFALQPVSLEGETGLNARATVTALWLSSARAYRHHYHHHRR
jgi:Protein of unknown function (DUF992)